MWILEVCLPDDVEGAGLGGAKGDGLRDRFLCKDEGGQLAKLWIVDVEVLSDESPEHAITRGTPGALNVR